MYILENVYVLEKNIMSWLNKSLSQLTDVTSSISKFTEDVLAAEPPTQGGEDETGDDGQLAAYRRQLGTGFLHLPV